MIVALDNDFFCKTEVLGVAALIRQHLGVDISGCYVLASLPHQLDKAGSSLQKAYAGNAARLAVAAKRHPRLAEPPLEWMDRLVGRDDIDRGEVQLLAHVAGTDAWLLATHDKRCIRAIPKVEGLAAAVHGKVICLETVLLFLCSRMGVNAVRAAVCPQLHECNDQAMRACFGGHESSVIEGLTSYVEELKRDTDPEILWAPEA